MLDEVAARLLSLTGSLPPWALALWEQPNTRVALALLLVAVVVMLVWRPQDRAATRSALPKPKLLREGAPWHLPLLWRPRRPWRVGGVTVDLHEQHAACIGGTGSGKTLAMVSLVRQAGRRKRVPTIVLTMDRSGPVEQAMACLERKGIGITWRPTGSLGWRILEGSPDRASARAVGLFPGGPSDTGFFRDIARAAVWDCLERLDAHGQERTLARVAAYLGNVEAKDRMQQEATRRWAQRFGILARTLGPALGTELDLAEAMRKGLTVHLALDAFEDRELCQRFATVAVSDCMRAATEVGNFVMVADEVGAVDPGVLDDLLRAGRYRGVSVVLGTQNPAPLGDMLRNNIAVWLLLGLGSGARQATFDWCSSVTLGMIEPEGFAARSSLKVRHGYLVWGGHIARVVVPIPLSWRLGKLLSWRPQRRAAEDVEDAAANGRRRTDGSVKYESSSASDSPATVEADNGIVIVEEVQPIRREPLALPAPRRVIPDYVAGDPDRLKVWLGLSGTEYDGCWLWAGHKNSSNYGIASYQGRQDPVHHLMFSWSRGIPLEQLKHQTRHKQKTIDHCCPVPNTLCARPEHLALISNSENVRLQWERRRKRYGKSAGRNYQVRT